MIQTLNLDLLHVIIRETDGLVGAADVLWDKTYEPFPKDSGFMEEIETCLWEGL